MTITTFQSETDPFFLIPILPIHQIHVDGEGDVLHHDQAVSHSNASQDKVDRVGPHVLVGQHQHVHHVEDGAYQADC